IAVRWPLSASRATFALNSLLNLFRFIGPPFLRNTHLNMVSHFWGPQYQSRESIFTPIKGNTALCPPLPFDPHAVSAQTIGLSLLSWWASGNPKRPIIVPIVF
ncbi:hypothetical protein, partial [Desulfosoma sp.]